MADLVAEQMARERELRRKREREAEEANPFAALLEDLPEDEADAAAEEAEGREEWTSVKQRKELRAETVDKLKKKLRGEEGPDEDEEALELARKEQAAAAVDPKEKTLLDEANAIRAAQANMDVKEIRLARAAAEEERMRKDADRVQTNALMSVAEVAAGTKYSSSLSTG